MRTWFLQLVFLGVTGLAVLSLLFKSLHFMFLPVIVPLVYSLLLVRQLRGQVVLCYRVAGYSAGADIHLAMAVKRASTRAVIKYVATGFGAAISIKGVSDDAFTALRAMWRTIHGYVDLEPLPLGKCRSLCIDYAASTTAYHDIVDMYCKETSNVIVIDWRGYLQETRCPKTLGLGDTMDPKLKLEKVRKAIGRDFAKLVVVIEPSPQHITSLLYVAKQVVVVTSSKSLAAMIPPCRKRARSI